MSIDEKRNNCKKNLKTIFPRAWNSGKSGLLNLRQKMRRKGKRVPYYKEFRNRDEIQARVDKDHEEWLANLPRNDEK